jgi:hypothetical protein
VQIFDDWVRQHKKCVELKGDYVEKKLNWFERLTSLNVKNFYCCAPGVSMLIVSHGLNLMLVVVVSSVKLVLNLASGPTEQKTSGK